MGIANLGGTGTVNVDGKLFTLQNRDVLYVGRGAREISVASLSPLMPLPDST